MARRRAVAAGGPEVGKENLNLVWGPLPCWWTRGAVGPRSDARDAWTARMNAPPWDEEEDATWSWPKWSHAALPTSTVYTVEM